ncbi:transposase [Gemmatimonas sp.]|uniref:transposase n=1 Tax=Gemmatimonas sp. TaxID=1962908 RepID=UPI003983832A
MRGWLAAHPHDRPGAKGAIRQRHRIDSARAKMATSQGGIQGYTGVAAVDRKHQILVDAHAHGTESEQEILLPLVTAIRPLLTKDSRMTADAGYHRDAHLQELAALPVDALIADHAMRKRDDRVATQARHQHKPDPLHNTTHVKQPPAVFQPDNFTYDAEARTCVCPAGKALYRKGKTLVTKGFVSEQCRGAKRDGAPCA